MRGGADGAAALATRYGWELLSSWAGAQATPRESCLEWGWKGGLGQASCSGKAKGVEGVGSGTQ